MAPVVKIFTAGACPYCAQMKNFLDGYKIAYQERDVLADRAALKEMKDVSNQLGVPVIDVDGTIVVGFDREGIARLLGLKNDEPVAG